MVSIRSTERSMLTVRAILVENDRVERFRTEW